MHQWTRTWFKQARLKWNENDSWLDSESSQGCWFLQWKYPNVLFKKCTLQINSCMLVYLWPTAWPTDETFRQKQHLDISVEADNSANTIDAINDLLPIKWAYFQPSVTRLSTRFGSSTLISSVCNRSPVCVCVCEPEALVVFLKKASGMQRTVLPSQLSSADCSRRTEWTTHGTQGMWTGKEMSLPTCGKKSAWSLEHVERRISRDKLCF